MSINYKKMASLIEQEVNKTSNLSSFQKERLSKLGNTIYKLESSVDSISSQKMIEEIRKEISLAASVFYANGGDR